MSSSDELHSNGGATTAAVDDPRLTQGRQFLKECKFEDAIGMLSSFLQSRVEEFGELSPEAAAAYYEYGNALLVLQEENPSGDLISGKEGDEPPPDVEVSDDEEGEGGDTGGDDEGDNEDGAAAGEDVDDDLQIAWENLDTARVILEKVDVKDELLLSSIYIRLGDLMRLEERPDTAVEEYSKALEIRSRLCGKGDRRLCDVYFCLATACIDLSGKKEGDETSDMKREALKHYKDARQTLVLEQKAKGGSEEVSDLIDVLSETIDALEVELREASSSSSSRAAEGPVTTIGFGPPPSELAKRAAPPAAPAAFGAKEGDSGNVVTLQAKKKRKVEDA